MAIATDFKSGVCIAYIEYYPQTQQQATGVENQVTWLHFKFADRCE